MSSPDFNESDGETDAQCQLAFNFQLVRLRKIIITKKQKNLANSLFLKIILADQYDIL